jgi:3-deoxy-manno-octulosonate cytidylyltransferase (CMP-KDO synthetase)
VVGVIPARWASTRLPGKSLVPLCGKPLIQWVAERARGARRLDRLLVATDDRRICEVVRALGVECVMTRPDHPSGTDRIAEAVQGVAADVIINIQGDEPMIEPALIDELAEVMTSDSRWDMATAAAPIRCAEDLASSSLVKVVFDAEGRALYFSRYPIPFVRDGRAPEGEVTHWGHVGIYAYRRAFLDAFVKTPPSQPERLEKLEQLRALHIGARIKVVPTAARGIGVDTPEDVKRVEALLSR